MMVEALQRFPDSPELALLICLLIVICCISLVYVTHDRLPIAFDSTTFHVFYKPVRFRGPATRQ